MKTFVLIGAGRIADRHVNAIIKNYGKLLGVFDTDQITLKAFCYRLSLKPFSSEKEAIKAAPDFFVICSDSGSHFELGMKYINHADLIIEKPLCVGLQDAEELINYAENIDKNIFVTHQNRFNNSVMQVHDYFAQHTDDEIFLSHVSLKWCRDDNYYDQASWRGKYKTDGSVLSNQAIHHLDLLLFFLGEHHDVFASGGTIGSQIEVPDTVVATIKFDSGALATVEASTAIRPKNIEASISLCWNRGTLKIGGTAANTIEYFFNDLDTTKNLKDSTVSNSEDVYGAGHEMMYKYIIEDRKTVFLTSGQDALRTLKLINDIHCSLEQNRMVQRSENMYSKRLGIK